MKLKSKSIHAAAARDGIHYINEWIMILKTVDIQDYFDRTALHCAVINYCKENAVILIKHGTDINIKDYQGNTAMHYSIEEDGADILKILLENGADQKITNNEGDTAFDMAKKSLATECLKVFEEFNKTKEIK